MKTKTKYIIHPQFKPNTLCSFTNPMYAVFVLLFHLIIIEMLNTLQYKRENSLRQSFFFFFIFSLRKITSKLFDR